MPLLQRKGNPNAVKAFSPEEAQGALASGEWEGRDAGEVGVASRDRITGEERNLPLTEALRRPSEFTAADPGAPVHAAMAEADRRQFDTGGQEALAGLEGIGASLTLGGSDVLLSALGAHTGDRARVNPVARAVPEIATTIATSVATGGLGAAGTVGRVGSLLAKATPLGAVMSRTGKLAKSVGGVKGLMLAEGAEGLVQAGGAVVSKLAIKDEEFTAKAALLDLGLGAVLGVAGGGAAGLFGAAGKAAKGAAIPKGIPLDNIEGKDFQAFTKNVIDDFKKADDDVIRNVAVRRKADEAGQPFVRNLKNDYLFRAQKELESVGGNIEATAAKVLSVPTPPPSTPTQITSLQELPNEILAGDNYVARNVLQLYDETHDALKAFGVNTSTAQRIRGQINREIAEFDKAVGTGATKGRSKLYGPENAYKNTADWDKVKPLYQKYENELTRLATESGNGRVIDEMVNGIAGTPGTLSRRMGLQDFYDEALEELAPRAAKEAEEFAKYTRVKRAHDEAVALRSKFQADGGFGDTVRLGAEPGEALLRGAAGEDYLTAVRKLANEMGQDVPEPFLKNFAKFRDDLDAVASQVSKGPLAAKDLGALRQLRKNFRRHNWDVGSFVNKSEAEAFEMLNDMSEYTKSLTNAGSKLAIPNMISALEENAAQMTRRLESLTGLGAKDIDRAYKQLMERLGGPPAQFEGPASDLHKLWLVNQAMKDGGEIGRALKASIQEAQEALNQGGLYPRTAKVIKSGIRRGAGFAAFSAASNVAGPLVGSAAAGMVSQAIMSNLNATGFLSQATGKALSAIGTTANLAAKASRAAGATIGTIVRQTSFGSDEKQPPKNETARQTFERLGKEVTDLAVDPGTPMRANEALAGIRDVSWGVGDKMEVMALDAVRYLADKYPKDPGILQRWGMSTWKPTEAQVTEWLNRVAATVNPLNSIKRFMSGGGTPAEAETIRQVHPELFREFQMAFMENLPAVKDKIPGATRVRLGILFNAPIDSRLRPEFRQFMREDWVARAEAQKPVDVNAGMTPEQPTPAQKLLG